MRKITYKQWREIYLCYVETLRALQKSKAVSCEPPSIVAFAILGMLNWCYRWYKEDGSLTIEEIAERLIGIVFHGILNVKDP